MSSMRPRLSLGRGDPQAALDSARQHARRFPNGQLAEEREAIAIEALARLGRQAEARTRAEHFRRVYPSGALIPAIDDALEP